MTGQELFEKAIHLCGLGSPETDIPTDVKDLEIRAVALINALLAENSILDCKIRKCTHRVYSINALSDSVICSEILAQSVLPYGLARLFLMGEDSESAAELGKIYTQNRENAIRFGNSVRHEITEVYA